MDREAAAVPKTYFMNASGLCRFIRMAESALPTILAAMKHAKIMPGANRVSGQEGEKALPDDIKEGGCLSECLFLLVFIQSREMS